MKLAAQTIPVRFVRAIPRGFRLVQKEGHDFLLVESVFCPNGHNLVVDSVRIHGEASVKLKIVVSGESGFVFVDAFWGSHAKLFSFIPPVTAGEAAFAEGRCPYCDVAMVGRQRCPESGCGSQQSIVLMLPGGTNTIQVCARLGCPGHGLDVVDMPSELVRSVSVINYFGAGSDEFFGEI